MVTNRDGKSLHPGTRGSLMSSAWPPPVQHLNQTQLARRWNVSPRTLERWRWRKLGPPYLKISHKVVYRLADIQAYEAAQLRMPNQAADPFFRRVR